MSLILSEYAGLPFWTSTTIGATGTTNLVAAPGAGVSLVVLKARVINFTNTTGFVDLQFVENATTTASRLRSLSSSIAAAPLDGLAQEPWLLDTNLSLDAVLSVTAASTPSVRVEICAQRLTRRVDNELRISALKG